MPTLSSKTKPFLTYPQLIALLEARGMTIDDAARGERKLSQVGYYRLSGFWHPCRKIKFDSNGAAVVCPATGLTMREDSFLSGTTFNNVFSLYLFDKKLRMLMLDAIERIEIFIRSIIAHELGYHDPLAHLDAKFINPKQTQNFTDRSGNVRNIWHEWSTKQANLLKRSQADCIVWHRQQQKNIPIWVAIEAWDFGTMSKFFEILKQRYQNKICARIGGVTPRELRSWLLELNTLRNRCAHHSRIWNQQSRNPLPVPSELYFQKLQLSNQGRRRIFGLISILWFLVQKVGANSTWIQDVASVVDSKPVLPNCSYKGMGFNDENGFPMALFDF